MPGASACWPRRVPLSTRFARGCRLASRLFLTIRWKSGAFRPLISFARTTRYHELPDVPTGRELTKDPNALALLDFAEAPFYMALPVVAPPDLPPDRAKALQTAFMAMTKDPAFIAEVEKMNLDLSPIDGESVRKVIAQMGATPKDVIAQYATMAGAKN